jgi:hypothetical protein
MDNIVKVCKTHGELTKNQVLDRKLESGNLGYRCRECIRLKSLKYFRENREKARESKRKWEEANKQKISLRRKEYWQHNKDRLAFVHAEWKAKNPEKVKESSKRCGPRAVAKYLQRLKEDEEFRRKENERNRIRGLKSRENLSDSYIRRRLTAHKDFTLEIVQSNPALIDIKRAIVALRRAKRNE